jgi:hypothetical protein
VVLLAVVNNKAGILCAKRRQELPPPRPLRVGAVRPAIKEGVVECGTIDAHFLKEGFCCGEEGNEAKGNP